MGKGGGGREERGKQREEGGKLGENRERASQAKVEHKIRVQHKMNLIDRQIDRKETVSFTLGADVTDFAASLFHQCV